jgi:hypothetical protein
MKISTARKLLIDSQPVAPTEPIRNFAIRKLTNLCTGLGEACLIGQAIAAFDALASPWSTWALNGAPPWSNDITDDGTPFEFSVAFGERGTQVRLLSESQTLPMSPVSTWRAGLALNERLASEYGADLSSFHQVADLFAPSPSIASRFLIWHAVMLSQYAGPVFKLYLNPRLMGPEAAFGIVDQALKRLGLTQARQFFARRLRAESQVAYLSFDLISAAEQRIKVYVDHVGVGGDYIDEYVQGAKDIQPGQAASWIQRLTAGRPLSC